MPRTTSFNNKWANGGDKTPFAQFVDRVNTGWEGGVDKDAPRAPQQNAWQFRADEALQDLERQGVMSWLPDAVYGLGAPTYGSDGNFYESLQANNTGNNPTSTSGFWRQVGSSFFSGVPVGTIISVAHNDAPDSGWLKCNGSSLSRASYARLFAKIGTIYGAQNNTSFNLPDLRGEFLRGLDDGRGVNLGRVMGSNENQSFQAHRHDIYGDAQGAQGFTSGTEVPDGYSDQPRNNEPAQIYLGRTRATGGNETRPRNVAVVYWIKF